MPKQNADFLAILEMLASFNVKYIVVGGVSAVLHGAPVTTFDVDIVYDMSRENLKALEDALKSMGAYYRGRGSQRLGPDAKQLQGGGHHLFNTDLGPVDLLSFIGKGHTYESLLGRSEIFKLDDLELVVLSLPGLIEIKAETMREKDEVHLRILRQVLAEQEQARGC